MRRFLQCRTVPLGAAAMLLLLVCNPAQANIRAPREIKEHQARELEGSKPELEVQNEELSISCEAWCNVHARYVILATADLDAELHFLAPVLTGLRVKTGEGQEIKATFEVLQIGERNAESPGPETELYRSKFTVHFRKGINQLDMKYEHRLGSEEVGYGYHSTGEMRPQFRYALWPLKEWKLAKDFTLKLSVKAPYKEPNRFLRFFRSESPLRCFAEGGDQPSTSLATKNTEEGYLVEGSYDKDFPRTLYCSIP